MIIMSTPSTHALSPNKISRLVVICIVLSTVAALIFSFAGQIHSVRGLSGSVGFMTALVGSGVAFWFSARSGDARLISAALLSGLPLAFWCWKIYLVIHV